MKKQNYFWLYILECDNGKYYTGYTKDLAKRYALHKEGKSGAKFTRMYKPLRIAGCWKLYDEVGTALKIEVLIKRLSRPEKEKVVENPKSLKKIVERRYPDPVKIRAVHPDRILSSLL